MAPTIGIITALPLEYVAVEALVENAEEIVIPGRRGAGRRYLSGTVPAHDGCQHSVVLCLADMGNNSAAIRASSLLEHFQSVDSIIMVGIAGGVPNPEKVDEHVRLGDVVVSDKKGIVQYDFEKETTSGTENRSLPRPPSAHLLEAVRLLSISELKGEYPWRKFIHQAVFPENYHYPDKDEDVLHDAKHQKVIIPHPKDPKRVDNEPRIFLGPIAAANKLLKNPIRRDWLRDEFGVKAIEMEGSGIADATWNHEIGYLVIRGICDYCDEYKNDRWQPLAAAVAAAYTRALIESIPLGSPPKRTKNVSTKLKLKTRKISLRERELLARILSPSIQEIEHRLRYSLNYWGNDESHIPRWDCSFTTVYFKQKKEILKSLSRELSKKGEKYEYKEIQSLLSRIMQEMNELTELLEGVPSYKLVVILNGNLFNFKRNADKLQPILREARFKSTDGRDYLDFLNEEITINLSSLTTDKIQERCLELADEASRVSPFIC